MSNEQKIIAEAFQDFPTWFRHDLAQARHGLINHKNASDNRPACYIVCDKIYLPQP